MRVNFDTLYKNYPSSDPSHPNYLSQRDLFTEIGWDDFIGNPNYHNTCAIRVSIAFVKSGVNIVPASHRIQKGPYAGKGIEVNMRRLATLMKRTSYLGEPEPFTPRRRATASARATVSWRSTISPATPAAVISILCAAARKPPNALRPATTIRKRSGSGLQSSRGS